MVAFKERETSMELIRCENVCMNYDKRLAVDNVSFNVVKGDYLCIVGENGSGKSTLMKGLLGLMKIYSGNIIYSGINKNEIGYLPQQTIIQKDFPASVYEVVLSGCLNKVGFKPFYSTKEKERAKQNMDILNISELASKSYRDLSGGQQQRVLLARALSAASGLLVLDEPVTGLDPLVTADMYSVIKSLNQSDNITVIMVSHDISSAVRFSNKILQLASKRIFFGSTDEYITTDAYRRMCGQN